MLTCPRCGARNNPDAVVCRLCSTVFSQGDRAAGNRNENADIGELDSLSPTVIVPALNPNAKEEWQGADAAAVPNFSPCPHCGTMNEVGWAFCQFCGKKLSMPPAPAEVVQPVVPPAAPQPPRSSGERSSPQDFVTVVADRRDLLAAEKALAEKHAAAADPEANPAEVQGMGGPGVAPSPVFCPQCGHENNKGSAFCSKCGSAIPVADTAAMSAVTPPPKGRLRLIMEGGQQGDVYDLEDETIVGRTHGGLSFPHDGFMSGRHASIKRRESGYYLQDEGSRNGTFIKIKGEVALEPGDVILIGKQLFRFETESGEGS